MCNILLGNFLELLFDSEKIIMTGGIVLIVLVVFFENGVIFTFFLPGDYLLFLSGLFCANGILEIDITTLTLLIFFAALLGCFFGYYFGRRVGYTLYNRKESRFFKKKYLEEAEKFFNKWGGRSIILSRFLPIVRTFVPVLAGIAKYRLKLFAFYTFAGVTLWVSSLVLGGYFLGQEFPQLKNYIHYIIAGFLLVTTITLIKSWMVVRKQSRS